MNRLKWVAVALVVLLVASATAAAGGKLTLKSLDKRLRALTALVLLNERDAERNPPRLHTRTVSERLTPTPNGNGRFFDGDASCSYDEDVLGGGAHLGGAPGGSAILTSQPIYRGWHVVAYIEPNPYTSTLTLEAYAVCGTVGP
jgi:hypothetical protein